MKGTFSFCVNQAINPHEHRSFDGSVVMVMPISAPSAAMIFGPATWATTAPVWFFSSLHQSVVEWLIAMIDVS